MSRLFNYAPRSKDKPSVLQQKAIVSLASTGHKEIAALWLPGFHDFGPFLSPEFLSGKCTVGGTCPQVGGHFLLACSLSKVGYAVAVHFYV